MIYDLIRYFDMFAGIGGFRAGLTRAGGFQCVGHCEIDKYADASYRAIHNPGKEEFYYPDARTINPRRRKLHILRFAASDKAQSFRCSSFQNRTRCAGLRFCFPSRAPRRNPAERFRRGAEAQGSVRGATAGRSKTERTLRRRGYGIEWLVLNSKDFGVPQSRRRVYIVCYLDRRCAGKVLPVRPPSGAAPIRLFGTRLGARVYDPSGTAITQLTDGRGLYLTAEGRVRRLTPRESLRLQGFREDQIDRLLAITSDAQAYKQAGNSVTVNVIEAIGRNMKAVHEELRGGT